MDINKITSLLNSRAKAGFDVYERRPGKYQVIVPILYEDGDMVDIYLQDNPKDEDYTRICDFGMALMRLSYTYEVNTPSRQKILDSILINNSIQNDNGNLYLDTPIEMLYESILQFAGCIQKICNMRYWSREIIRSTFYEDLGEYIKTELKEFDPKPDIAPVANYEILTVDWSLSCKDRKFYLFGVRGNNKAKDTAIALLEFKKVSLPFISLAIHEDMQDLGSKEAIYLTRNADKQYPKLDDFCKEGKSDMKRIAA